MIWSSTVEAVSSWLDMSVVAVNCTDHSLPTAASSRIVSSAHFLEADSLGLPRRSSVGFIDQDDEAHRRAAWQIKSGAGAPRAPCSGEVEVEKRGGSTMRRRICHSRDEGHSAGSRPGQPLAGDSEGTLGMPRAGGTG